MKHAIEIELAASETERENLRATARQQFNAIHEPVARMVRIVLTEIQTETAFYDH